MSDEIDIKGLDPAELLMELYNGTSPLGVGVLNARPHFTLDDARKCLAQYPEPDRVRFDYVYGRPVKVEFVGATLKYAWLYDRDARGGPGSCAAAVERVRQRQLAKLK